ncbi:MAG: hypothetical protein LUF84_05890 [Clostridiales bacterium]|nr:hypothetical protein [Clostridiales bacterium]
MRTRNTTTAITAAAQITSATPKGRKEQSQEMPLLMGEVTCRTQTFIHALFPLQS